MDLTPIRIRGRRKRGRMSEKSDAAQKLRDRPWKAARFNQASLQSLKNKKTTKRDPTLSRLEQLPTELVQVIFEYCNNISMPMSSFVIARDLSYRNVYLRFAIDTLSADDASGDKEVDAVAVSRLLQCKWMTWDIFKDAVQEVYKKRLPPSRASSPSPSLESTASEEEQAAQNQDQNQEQDEQTQENPPAPNFVNPDLQPHLSYLSLSSQVQLPRSLLYAPFTSSSLAFLRYLVYNHCRINWLLSSRGETATSGLSSAISLQSSLAVALLCCPAISVTPTTPLLRQAIFDAGCNTTIIFYLLAAAIRAHVEARNEGSSMPEFSFRDPGVWSWCARVEEAGSRKGRWVKEALRLAGDLAGGSVWDREVFEEFKRAVGRVEDGVVEMGVPVVEVVAD